MQSRLESETKKNRRWLSKPPYRLYVHNLNFQGGMFGLFNDLIGLSTETGYDWTQPSSEAMGEEQSLQDTATAQPGTILIIEQAIHISTGPGLTKRLFLGCVNSRHSQRGNHATCLGTAF